MGLPKERQERREATASDSDVDVDNVGAAVEAATAHDGDMAAEVAS